MAINLDNLSPAELQSLIANAESQMKAARINQVHAVREKIDAVLQSSGLTLADVYPTRGGKAAKGGSKAVVAPKYRNPDDASQTWAGRGKPPHWFSAAIKRPGVTRESLLIESATKATPRAKAAKAAPKATKKVVKKVASKKTAKR